MGANAFLWGPKLTTAHGEGSQETHVIKRSHLRNFLLSPSQVSNVF